jgi:hypothetical protein
MAVNINRRWASARAPRVTASRSDFSNWQHGVAKAKDVVEALGAKGIKVTTKLVYKIPPREGYRRREQ